jgi:hypothetical protein
METLTMVERPSIFFIERIKKIDKILVVRLDWLFWARNEMGCSFFLWNLGLDLWRCHTISVQVERPWEFVGKGLDFGLGLWRLHTLLGQSFQFLYFIGYFQTISLDSQQSFAIQSNSLSTWTAIVWSNL